jgi:hypothetical protein
VRPILTLARRSRSPRSHVVSNVQFLFLQLLFKRLDPAVKFYLVRLKLDDLALSLRVARLKLGM